MTLASRLQARLRPASLLRQLPLALLAAAVLTQASAMDQSPSVAVFDWFEYSGRDAADTTALPAGHYANPILAGFYPDPSICRVGDDYYLVNSTFAYFPGIPIFHTRDLVNWEQIGHAIHRPTQLNYDNLATSRGLFAPALSWHDGTFYLVCTMVDGGGNFLVTAKNPAGPWSDPLWLDFEGIDPSLFFDDDGRAWLINNGAPEGKPLYSGHRAIWSQEFDLATRRLVGPRRVLVNGGVDLAQKPVWIEGPHLYRKDGWYFLCCAEGGTGINHSQVILRSRSVTGPFEPWSGNPILTQRDLDATAPHAITCTGHADLTLGPDGQWWAVFLACRPYAGRFHQAGRETFLLPVSWPKDGWPVILPHGQRVPLVAASPAGATVLPAAQRRTAPLNGNFTHVDEFDGPELPLHWLMLRAPRATWWKLDRGQLLITPQPGALTDQSRQPAFLARRIQHATYDAGLLLHVPAAPSVEAGLAVFQTEAQHFTFTARRIADRVALTLTRVHQGKPETVATRTIPATERLELRLHADRTRFTFAFALPAAPAETLAADVDSFPVTVQAAGDGLHFTGAVIGPFVRQLP